MDLKYKIIIDFDFNFNHNMIENIYRPILGKNIINLYKDLISLHAANASIGANLSFFFKDLLKFIDLDEKTFFEYIKKLEAINLVEKYIDQFKQETMIIYIKPCLNWTEFKQNNQFYHLLQSKLEPIEIEKTRLLFEPKQLIDYINTSASFNEVFGNDLKNEFSLDFDLFYQYLFNKTKQLVCLNKENKEILNNAYTKYQLQFNDLIKCINESIYQINNHEFAIDNLLLTASIKKHLDQNNLKQFNLNLKINRNKQIFFKDQNLEDFKYVINDYKTLNSEHYLACIQKHSLDNIQLETISSLRKKYHLNDYLINILIDFSIYKNNGRVEQHYLEKIASTINRLEINTVEKLLRHLQNSFQVHNNILENEIKW